MYSKRGTTLSETSLQSIVGKAERNKFKIPPPREEPKKSQLRDILLQHQESKLKIQQQNHKEERLLVPYNQQVLQLRSKDPDTYTYGFHEVEPTETGPRTPLTHWEDLSYIDHT